MRVAGSLHRAKRVDFYDFGFVVIENILLQFLE